MKWLSTKEIRKLWLAFFARHQHLILPSKSLVPHNDNSLLWINSGVATLKEYFSGFKLPPNPRMANSQKSLRTNDIDHVGKTARHLTFFEMLGNFAIGDYFKKTALKLAYKFLFEELKLSKEKIYITYFAQDQATYQIWVDLGIKPNHLIKGNRATNFWDVGQGPCGPDTEIFYDRGIDFDSQGLGLKLLEKDIENDRYLEIWNIVFSQFNNDGANNYSELKQKNIDTGAGLERLAVVMQNVSSVFETDAFQSLIDHTTLLSGQKYDSQINSLISSKQVQINRYFRIIVDHLRAVVMAINDGVRPTNLGRGYIIRRLIRRAYRAGLQLGINQSNFLATYVALVASNLDVYQINQPIVSAIITQEEKAFQKTIKQGYALLEKALINQPELPFKIAYKLFETYGFPLELTQEIVAERGIKLDVSQFHEFQKHHAQVSQGQRLYLAMEQQINFIQEVKQKISHFCGYEALEITSTILKQGFEKGNVYLLTKETPFYATSGGQLFDHGWINGQKVLNVFKDKYGNHWHVLKTQVQNPLKMQVDRQYRLQAARNHSATHLLAHALVQMFGSKTIQIGSENDNLHLRYDFPALKKPTSEQLLQLEAMVKAYIRADYQRKYLLTTFEQAEALGATKMENETYGSQVRLVDFGLCLDFCGGTHVEHTSLIEDFKIIKLESKGSGQFRIEALTSKQTIANYETSQLMKAQTNLTKLIQKNLQLNHNYVLNYNSQQLTSVQQAIVQAQKDNKKLKKLTSKNVVLDFTKVVFEDKAGIKLYHTQISNPVQLKPTAVLLREKYPEALIILEAKITARTLVAVASKTYDSVVQMQTFFPNIKGGGNKILAMGSLPNA